MSTLLAGALARIKLDQLSGEATQLEVLLQQRDPSQATPTGVFHYRNSSRQNLTGDDLAQYVENKAYWLIYRGSTLCLAGSTWTFCKLPEDLRLLSAIRFCLALRNRWRLIAISPAKRARTKSQAHKFLRPSLNPDQVPL